MCRHLKKSNWIPTMETCISPLFWSWEGHHTLISNPWHPLSLCTLSLSWMCFNSFFHIQLSFLLYIVSWVTKIFLRSWKKMHTEGSKGHDKGIKMEALQFHTKQITNRNMNKVSFCNFFMLEHLPPTQKTYEKLLLQNSFRCIKMMEISSSQSDNWSKLVFSSITYSVS